MSGDPARRVVLVGLATMAVGSIGVATTARRFLDTPFSLDSNSGRSVFLQNGVLGSYGRFDAGVWPTIIGVGAVVLVAGLVLCAALWRGRGQAS